MVVMTSIIDPIEMINILMIILSSDFLNQPRSLPWNFKNENIALVQYQLKSTDKYLAEQWLIL